MGTDVSFPLKIDTHPKISKLGDITKRACAGPVNSVGNWNRPWLRKFYIVSPLLVDYALKDNIKYNIFFKKNSS
jgi:hypothetical protein